jgi:hypothetical protein
MVLWLIIFCEIAFWVLLASGLVARYVFNLRRTSTVLLICVPLIDVVLLIATVSDLQQSSAPANFAHGLAALYIGFTIAFGRITIRWADRWFAYKFGSAPRPNTLPAGGWRYVWNEWKLFGRALIAYTIAGTLILTAIYVIDDAERTAHLMKWPKILTGSAFFWFVLGPFYSMLFKRKVPAS